MKAFDSVEWGFLWAVLERMRFGPNFLLVVHAGGLLSGNFALKRDTRQRSPIFSVIWVGDRTAGMHVERCPKHNWFQCKDREETLDTDMLLYIGDVVSSQ